MTFQQRLQRAMRDGNLTVADLARWFGRPDPTVRCWVNEGRAPRGANHDVAWIEKRLGELERRIKRAGAMPVGLARKTRRAMIDAGW